MPAGDADARPRVLVVTVGSAGDMYPFLRVARDLAARGHRVTLAGPVAHAPMAAAAGVDFVGGGTLAQYQALLAHADLWHPRRGFAVLWSALRESLAASAEFVAALPTGERCVLFVHPLMLPAAALARAVRPEMPVIAGWLAPANLRSVHDPLTIGPLRIPRWWPLAWRRAIWRQVDARLVDPVALPSLNAARARFGLGPVDGFIAHMQAVADAHVTMFPPWFAPTPPDWPRPLAEGAFQLYDAGPSAGIPPALEAFLQAGDAPLVFMAGSANRQAARRFAQALAAVERLGRRAVFLSATREQMPAALPATVLWQPYAPLGALLPRCAAVIHHGGVGTMAEALRAGVPQLVMPLAYDQFDNGARVEALRVGRMLAGPRTGPRRLAATLAALLASAEVRAGCAAAAARIASDEPADVAHAVERLAGLTGPVAPAATTPSA